MSERGSFVTEYIYCEACLEAVKKVLNHRDKYLCCQQISSWNDDEELLPIIAGKVGGMYGGEEAQTFEFELVPEIAKLCCHNIRIAVIPEYGSPKSFQTDNYK